MGDEAALGVVCDQAHDVRPHQARAARADHHIAWCEIRHFGKDALLEIEVLRQ